jgi:ATP-dependent Clp protease ATP-binding subunit ClpC
MFQLPNEAKELDKELRQITKQKNEAVRGQDFEKVYSLLRIFCMQYCC